MSEKLRTIRLYGKLGATFGRVHKFVCNDTAGAVRALCIMVPGFQEFLYTSQDKGLAYAVFVGKENIGEDSLEYPVGDEDIRIAPVVLGAGGRNGLFQIIVGAALVVGAFYTGGATLAGMTAGAAGVMTSMGAALILGGVSQMLVKQPGGLTGVESVDNGASYNFNGPVNTTAQGNPEPVLYGRAIIGSATVSADMYSEDIQ